jgi:hypothetical protein
MSDEWKVSECDQTWVKIDTKGVIRSRKSKHRQYNGQKKKDKQ